MWIFKALVSSTGMVAQIESLRLALMHACLYVLGGFLVVLLLKWMVGTFAVLRWLRSSAFVPMLAIAAICTSLSAKFGLQNIFGFHHSQLPVTVGTVITPIDVTNGWRMAGESQGEEFAAMPTNAVVNERWLRRGAHDDSFRIPMTDWYYPLVLLGATVGNSGMTVLSRGGLRPNVRKRFFPSPFEADLSLVPLFNWPLLPEGRQESFLWHAATPSNTLLVTWWNALYNREATNPVNFQVELFPCGDFAYRYENHTVYYAPVWPFDWDGDGLENTVDPDPYTAGDDAHGTNVEWYNVVCSNIVSATTGESNAMPLELEWRDGVNSNAYYFIDVVALDGPAPIYFVGDGESRLGNPVVVANSCETNRVPLLVGVEYVVTSTVPLSVSAVSHDMVSVKTNTLSCYTIQRPLNFRFVGSYSTSGNNYLVLPMPFDPGGEFVWGAGGGMRLMGSMNETSCTYTGVGNLLSFTCAHDCACNGCSAMGAYHYEGYIKAFSGGDCGCGHEDEGGADGQSANEPTTGASISITLDKNTLVFENAYDNGDGTGAPLRSSTATVTCSFSAGEEDARVVFVVRRGAEKIDGAQSFMTTIGSHESASRQFAVTGRYHNDVGENVEFIATLFDAHGEQTATATLKVVELVVSSLSLLPSYRSRHVYGVCEEVQLAWYPSDVNVGMLTSGSGTWSHVSSTHRKYKCPGSAENPTFTVNCGNATFGTTISCVEPSNIVATVLNCIATVPFTNQAGVIGMELLFTLAPTNVCFEGLRVAEILTEDGIHTGYFSNPALSNWWYHASNSSTNWNVVNDDNSFAIDTAYLGLCDPPWSIGTMTWVIPNAWLPPQAFTPIQPQRIFQTIEQTFQLTMDGTATVSKHGQTVSRTTNDVITINGKRIR